MAQKLPTVFLFIGGVILTMIVFSLLVSPPTSTGNSSPPEQNELNPSSSDTGGY